MKTATIMSIVVMVLGVGCSSTQGDDKRAGLLQSKNRAHLKTLSEATMVPAGQTAPTITKATVLKIMGPAGKTEAYKTKTGGTLECLFYRTEKINLFSTKPEGEQASVEWTPICIIDGKLRGWGQKAYNDTIKLRK